MPKLMRINNVQISGYTTADVEIKHTQVSGVAIANFTVAINKKYQGDDGEWVDKTSFVKVVAWNKTAERCEGMTKGTPVYVQGEIDMREYKDNDGNNKRVFEVKAFIVQNLTDTAKDTDSGSKSAPATPKEQQQPDDDSDVPF